MRRLRPGSRVCAEVPPMTAIAAAVDGPSITMWCSSAGWFSRRRATNAVDAFVTMGGQRDDASGMGLADEVVELGFAGAMADTHDDEPGLLRTHERGVNQRAVGHEHDDALATSEIGRHQCGCDAVGHLVVHAPRHAVAVLVDEGRALRVGTGVTTDDVSEAVGAPPSLFFVLGFDGRVDSGLHRRPQNALGSFWMSFGTRRSKSSLALRQVIRSMARLGSLPTCACNFSWVCGHVVSAWG